MAKCLIDTNILVYSHETTDQRKHDVANKKLAGLFASGEGIISSQNLAEFSRVVVEKSSKHLPHGVAKEKVFLFGSAFQVINYSMAEVLGALDLMTLHKTHFFDALLAATMAAHGVTHILTENEMDFAQIPGITVINPFKE